jgi:hypothetical protein
MDVWSARGRQTQVISFRFDAGIRRNERKRLRSTSRVAGNPLRGEEREDGS